MTRPLSNDLRERVVAGVLAGESCRSIASRFGVAVSSVVKWSQRHQATGSVAPAKMGGRRKRALEPHRAFIVERINQTSHLTLHGLKDELAARGVHVSHNAVWLFLRREGLRFKKTLFALEQARSDVARRRQRWRSWQAGLDPRRLVFIDETWIKTNMTPLRGWGPKGKRRSRRTSRTPAIGFGSRRPAFPLLAALNDWLETRCRELWAQTAHSSQPGSVADAWAEEARHLMQLPRPFDGFVEYAKRVSPTCLVHLDRNRYSVPASFANRPVSVRVYPERIVVAAEGQIVCEHARVFARSHQRKSTTTVFDWRHYLAVIQRKPGALRNGAPFAELPPAFRALQQRMLKTPGGDREMVEILALVLQHDEQAVLTAVELALEAGAPTKTHILNLLHRLVDGKPMDTPPIKAPQALALTTEPQANVERYDALRKTREARHAS